MIASRADIAIADLPALYGIRMPHRDEQGNSMAVNGHSLDAIKTADWVLDLGPEGGLKGGEIVAQGVPEAVGKVPDSFTGRYLAPLLERRPGTSPS
jgi:excinuclease ABC subunit A